MIQSVLLDKSKFRLEEGIKWMIKHKYKPNTSAPNFDTTNYWRFRQVEPSSQYTYRTKQITEGINLVLAYPKKKSRKSHKGKNNQTTKKRS